MRAWLFAFARRPRRGTLDLEVEGRSGGAKVVAKVLGSAQCFAFFLCSNFLRGVDAA